MWPQGDACQLVGLQALLKGQAPRVPPAFGRLKGFPTKVCAVTVRPCQLALLVSFNHRCVLNCTSKTTCAPVYDNQTRCSPLHP